MIPFSDKSVFEVFSGYPDPIQEKMYALRDLIFVTSEKIGVDAGLSEALKWGEPSYLCKTGSTIRIHWKESDPEFYRMFFHCQTSLITTFRELYSDAFEFEGNRAIRFSIKTSPNLELLENCIRVSLKYHLLKDLPHKESVGLATLLS